MRSISSRIWFVAFIAVAITTIVVWLMNWADATLATAAIHTATLPILIRIPKWPWITLPNGSRVPQQAVINPNEIAWFEGKKRRELSADADRPDHTATVIHMKNGDTLVSSMFDDEFLHFLQTTQRMGWAAYDGRDQDAQEAVQHLRSELKGARVHYEPADFQQQPERDEDGRELTSPADRVGPGSTCQLCDEPLEEGQALRFFEKELVCEACYNEAVAEQMEPEASA